MTKGQFVPSLSRDKVTMGQSQNLATKQSTSSIQSRLDLLHPFQSSPKGLALKVSKSQKKICCPRFSKKTNAGAFLCTEKCPIVHFFGESRITYFFLRFTDLQDHLFCNHYSRKVQKSGSRKVVLQTPIFFSGQPLFSNLKKS